MTWLIVVLVGLAVVAVGVWAYRRSRRAALERRFGPYYERAVEAHGGDRRRAEASLRAVARRRDALDVPPLERPVRVRYVERWRQTQLRFVDEPAGAVRQADALVHEVLRERGYTLDGDTGTRTDTATGTDTATDTRTGAAADDEDDRLALVAVDHPELVADYRAARQADGGGTDALRETFLRTRALFDRLVEGPDDAAAGSAEPGAYGSVAGERRGPPG